MFTKSGNKKLAYVFWSQILNAFVLSSFGTNRSTRTETFVPLIIASSHAPDIALLQFINVTKFRLVEPLHCIFPQIL